MIEYAQVLYEVYAKSAEWKNYQGKLMPTWNELPENIQNNWRAVAEFIHESENQ
jgi:hypothetical protein